MLSLKYVHKDYVTGDTVVHALKGVSVDFRDNEFVSVLGASGCGKTTLLNILGGLDRYTTGDLIINGVSTKKYVDGDWDTYRNHTVGFVFQTYNLIMHQTVLGNVELALTLSGVSAKERREAAKRALEKVGLKEQINKLPNQLSGGQMQRVAIARAIVNNPDIILADEPTGALDTQTSVQIMDILKEIAKDKLVIMVTHNPDLAEKYSTRIVRLSDGELISDTNPVSPEEYAVLLEEAELKKREEEEYFESAESADTKKKPRKTRKKRPSMSFFTALTLSFRNLLTKKARTILVSFAGSIGIIGIALILSLSDGFQLYINKVQEDTLSSYPLTIERETVDMTAMASALLGVASGKEREKEPETVYVNRLAADMFNAVNEQTKTNQLGKFKKAFEEDEELKKSISAVKYDYDLDLNIFFEGTHPLNASKTTQRVSTSSVSMGNISSMMGFSLNAWAEMLNNDELIRSQYDLIGKNSRWPESYNELLVVLDEKEEINDYVLWSLGILSLSDILSQPSEGEERPDIKFTYDQILGLKYKLVLSPDLYEYDEHELETGTVNITKKSDEEAAAGGIDLEVVGIVKPKPAVAGTSINGTLAYGPDLTRYVMEKSAESYLVQWQLNNPDKDVLNRGKPFITPEEYEYSLDDVKFDVANFLSSYYPQAATVSALTEKVTAAMVSFYVEQGMTEEEAEAALIAVFEQAAQSSSRAYASRYVTYERRLASLGYADENEPQSISIYAADFEGKDKIVAWIENYNTEAKQSGADEEVISYTDYVGLMMRSVSTIINAISYVLIGFVAISLVVSSIMIGVITYISVLERTKEIGVLRSIGASKRDISRVFNAETFIIGFVAGLLGVTIAVLLDVPVNMILAALADLHGIAAVPWWGGIALVAVSVVLTLIAGIIPSRLAAKKDPVIALRSE
ncbi:MAG: ABC transporter ATP-binding protein/permease [Clostridia bacterium]|nr:ABC transporter ATP-binding protein/permease [Clostridia bacterium]